MIEFPIYYSMYQVLTSLTTFLPPEVAATTRMILQICNSEKWWYKLVQNLSMDILYLYIDFRLDLNFMCLWMIIMCLWIWDLIYCVCDWWYVIWLLWMWYYMWFCYIKTIYKLKLGVILNHGSCFVAFPGH
jgi:hypothetical protein